MGVNRDRPRRVREVACWRRTQLAAKGDLDRDQVLEALRQAISDLPTGAVVPAEDEAHLDLLPWLVDHARVVMLH